MAYVKISNVSLSDTAGLPLGLICKSQSYIRTEYNKTFGLVHSPVIWIDGACQDFQRQPFWHRRFAVSFTCKSCRQNELRSVEQWIALIRVSSVYGFLIDNV